MSGSVRARRLAGGLGRVPAVWLAFSGALLVFLASPVSALAAGVRDQSQTGTSQHSVAAWGNQWLAQTFIAGRNGRLDRVEIDISKDRSCEPGPLTVQIRTTTSIDRPGSTVLASASVPSGDVETSASYVAVRFTPRPQSVAGTEYAIVLGAPNADVNCSYRWWLTTNNPYERGQPWVSHDAGSTWPDSGGFDFNFATFVVPAAAGPELRLTKTPSTRSVQAGGQVTFALVVHNRGPGRATDVRVEDTAPPGLVFQQAHVTQGHCAITGGQLRCALGNLHERGEWLIQLTTTVTADASGPIVNRAIARSREGGPHPENGIARSTIHVTPAGRQPVSDLAVTKRVNHGTARLGQRLRYTITVTNHGPAAATGVRVTDTLALPFRVVSIHATHGNCRVGPPLTCTLGRLSAGAHTTIRIAAVATATGRQVNTVAVMSRSRDPHPRTSIASATTRITVRPTPPRFTG